MRGGKRQENTHEKRGVPLGIPLEKGTIIIHCMPRLWTPLVEARGILVWKLGQTCEAARNGTQMIQKEDSLITAQMQSPTQIALRKNILKHLLESILEKILAPPKKVIGQRA